MAVSTVREPVL